MANRNRNKVQDGGRKKKQYGKHEGTLNEQSREGRGKKVMERDIISITVALVALVVSILSMWSQYYYSDKEYHYKLDPELETQGNMKFGIQRGQDGHRILLDFADLSFQIRQENNLQAAYLIHANNEVQKLELDDIENTMETELDMKGKAKSPDIVEGDVSYNYKFLFLKELDGDYELFLLYLKADNDLAGYHEASGIEIWELERAHSNDEKYAGERKMAKQYVEILEGCEKYMIQ